MKKKILSCLLILNLAFVLVVAKPNMEAKAVGAAVASFFAAIPISWPVVAAVLIAGGIGTAAYYSTWDEEEKERLVDNIKQALNEAHMTMLFKAAEVGASVGNGADYITGAIKDGLVYIGEEYLNTFWNVAQENGMLRGDLSPFEPVYNEIVSGVSTSYDVAVSNVSSFFTSNSLTIYENALLSIWALGYTAVFTQTSQGYLYVTAFKPEDINGGMFKQANFGYTYLYLSGSSQVGNETPFAQYGKVASRIASNTSGFEWSTNTYSADGGSAYASFGSGYKTNLVTGTVSSTPVGEKGQVSMEQDGAWDTPWDSAVNIDDYGTALAVSIGSAVSAIWEAVRAIPEALNLPDIALDLDIDIPDYLTQAYAQEGVVDLPVSVPVESPVVPAVDQFLVPGWIKDKYPFCIPFDIVRCVQLFQNPGRAPRWEYVFRWGNQSYTFVLDLGDPMFTIALQTVRYGLLLVMCAWVISHSKNLVEGK